MKIHERSGRPGWRGCLVLFTCLTALPACVRPIPVEPLVVTPQGCGLAAALEPQVRWLSLSDSRSLDLSRSWCEPVGPVVVSRTAARATAGGGDIFIVSWNVAVGAGDVEAFLRRLADEERRAGRPAPEVVLLLQETYRAGGAVPARYSPRARVPRRIASGRGSHRDVESLAAARGMHFVYIPSMRNGGLLSGEDRGNAILSTVPFDEVTAIELPFEHQRRVAIAATLDVRGSPLTVVTVHLDTRRPILQGSIFSGPLARQRQAAALIDALTPARAAGPVIVGGDFNTLAGPAEPAIRSMERQFARVSCGSPLTRRWNLQLDYMFATDATLFAECAREAQRFGSDHHPLVARLRR